MENCDGSGCMDVLNFDLDSWVRFVLDLEIAVEVAHRISVDGVSSFRRACHGPNKQVTKFNLL